MFNIFNLLHDKRGFADISGDSEGAESDVQDKLHAQAMEEIEAEKEGREPKDLLSTPKKKKDDKGDGESDDPDDEQAGEGDDDGDAEAGKGKKADKKEGEDADDDSGEDGDDGDDGAGDDGGKPKDKKDGEDGEEGEESGEDLDKKITAYAEKYKMTYAEAKEDMDKTREIVKQFSGDPVKMAQAMRNKDREYQKLKTELDKAATRKPVFKRLTDEQFIKWAKNRLAEDGEKQIQKFREDWPAKSEGMSNEAIIEELALQALPEYKEKSAQKESEIRTAATKKRDGMIANLSEADRKFIPEIKAMLSETSDEDIINESVTAEDALYMAKGKRYDADIKAAEARGFKRGKEGATIIGAKSSSSGGSKPVSKKSAVSLNDRQKRRAIEMYGNNYEDDECYRLYVETFAEELKKDPKFV